MERIEDCISFVAGKAAQQVTRRARELLAPFGVTPAQYAVLKVLAETGGLSGAELGQRMVLDSASITGVVDRLEALGLAERRADPTDRRAQQIFASARTGELLAPMDAAMDRLNAEAAAVLGGEDGAFLQRLRQLGDQKMWKEHV
ncbi:MAG: MarR family transcriptional regulator [Rhodospirillaceae bacterium]|nr:MarR family transcriptional regulator [Rhodospirillaceae bacterium]